MSQSSQPLATVSPSFFQRLLHNDSTRKGLAAAAAGLLVGIVSEVLWPSS